jgi:hypothetical protein
MHLPAPTERLPRSPSNSRDSGSQRHAPGGRDGTAFAGQVGTIREMLSMLDTFTMAGQRHSMGKIADFVGQHVRRSLQRIGGRNATTLGELSAGLQHESARTAPDVATFTRHVEDLLVLVLAVT